MITLDGPASTALNSTVRGAPLLAELDFVSGTSYLCTWGDNVTVDGHAYIGLGNLASISNMSESDDLAARSISLSLSVVNSALLAVAVGSAGEYRRRAVRIYLQLIDSTYQPVGAKVLRWAGRMDSISIERRTASEPTSEGPSGDIILKCSRSGVPMSRRAIGLRSTHQQQQARYPSDTFLSFQQGLLETPTLWLSKRFQFQ